VCRWALQGLGCVVGPLLRGVATYVSPQPHFCLSHMRARKRARAHTHTHNLSLTLSLSLVSRVSNAQHRSIRRGFGLIGSHQAVVDRSTLHECTACPVLFVSVWALLSRLCYAQWYDFLQQVWCVLPFGLNCNAVPSNM
jgi:hypothetical protein